MYRVFYPIPRRCVFYGGFRGLIGSALDNISVSPEFESRRGHI